jgi:hypothetical protein
MMGRKRRNDNTQWIKNMIDPYNTGCAVDAAFPETPFDPITPTIGVVIPSATLIIMEDE